MHCSRDSALSDQANVILREEINIPLEGKKQSTKAPLTGTLQNIRNSQVVMKPISVHEYGKIPSYLRCN